MNLWLFSSGDGRENTDADTDLAKEMRTLRPRLTFIAAAADDSEAYYDEFVARFSRYGYKDFTLLAADRVIPQADLARALTCDLVYLSGGNTFHFLKHARQSGLLRELRRYVALNGRLAGHSAGAIMMTPTIATASFPEFDRDENYVGLTDWQALGLVNFEIFPHYTGAPEYEAALAQVSLSHPVPLYTLSDGACLHVHKRKLTVYGDVALFYRGIKSPLR